MEMDETRKNKITKNEVDRRWSTGENEQVRT
jgi:hypothetical protein